MDRHRPVRFTEDVISNLDDQVRPDPTKWLSNSAKFLDELGDFGPVERRKIADLVILAANPLDDSRNTQRIAAVNADGRPHPRERLDAILTATESHARTHQGC